MRHYRSIPFYGMWKLWKAQNQDIFDEIHVNMIHICSRIFAWVESLVGQHQTNQVCRSQFFNPTFIFPVGLFDDATQAGICGCEA